jgi:hypothetical protein
MNRKAYRATRVNDVNWEQIARGKEGLVVPIWETEPLLIGKAEPLEVGG